MKNKKVNRINNCLEDATDDLINELRYAIPEIYDISEIIEEFIDYENHIPKLIKSSKKEDVKKAYETIIHIHDQTIKLLCAASDLNFNLGIINRLSSVIEINLDELFDKNSDKAPESLKDNVYGFGEEK